MPWFFVDENLHAHPKTADTVDDRPSAMGLWVVAGSWCKGLLIDGVVPTRQVKRLGYKIADAEALVRSGLWEIHADGYVFHDWDHNQGTAAEHADLSIKRIDAGKKGGIASGVARRKAKSFVNSEASASSKDEAPLNDFEATLEPASLPSPSPSPLPISPAGGEPEAPAFTWQRASRLWCDATGTDPSTFSPSHHSDDLKAIVRAAKTEAELVRVLRIVAADPWVQKKKPRPRHLAANWTRYAAPQAEEHDPEQAAADRERSRIDREIRDMEVKARREQASAVPMPEELRAVIGRIGRGPES